jgi:hypothetical protein
MKHKELITEKYGNVFQYKALSQTMNFIMRLQTTYLQVLDFGHLIDIQSC